MQAKGIASMKSFNLLIYSIVILIFNHKLQAKNTNSGNCFEFQKNYEIYRAHRFFSTKTNTCWLSLSPIHNTNYLYRSFVFNNDGSLLVFNSFSEFEDGARSYMLFPRNHTPTIEADNFSLNLHTSNKNSQIYFSQFQKKIISSKGIKVTEDLNISPNNQGGIEIMPQEVLVLDGGWKKYSDPFASPNRLSVFKDHENNICKVKNSEIFDYDDSENKKFKFSDLELKAFLLKSCKNLNLSKLEL